MAFWRAEPPRGRGEKGGRGGGWVFTERCRQVLALAREEAHRLRHDYVGPEHITLALCKVPGGGAAGVLSRLGVEPAALVRALEATVLAGQESGVRRGDLPYTSRAKKVLELAMTEARTLGHDYVGTKHLLLGVVSEEKGVAAQTLQRLFGVTLAAARVAVLGGTADVAERASPRPEFRMQIDDSSERSIYEQIVARVQEAVATGELRPGERMPTVRQLADDLDVAPGTVARAYGELERLGVIVTDGARGTRVAERPRSATMADAERTETLVGLLRPVAVAAFHLGGTARELRDALEVAMRDIFGEQSAA